MRHRPDISEVSSYLAYLLRSGGAVWQVLLSKGPVKTYFWLVALGLGVAAGLTAVGFRLVIEALQSFLYQTPNLDRLHSFAGGLPWYAVLAVPVLGGLVVGFVLHRFTPDGRVRSVADVIEGAALNNGRVERRAGLASAVASVVTLSSGGSTGREGPVVHLAALISSWAADRMKASGIEARDLMGCAVAGAVSASFNAPIAGALFALEVVLRHFAVHAFAPIVIASVAGTVVSRAWFGDVTEFNLPEMSQLGFYAELPAFVLLGLVCGVVAVMLMSAIFIADDVGNYVQRRLELPRWLRPSLAGVLLGLIAIAFPHVIGVGYETTFRALSGDLLFWQAVIFVGVKILAVAITMGGRMGGGVFSPSLMVGAMTGLAFGLLATHAFPTVSGMPALYALAGMGAVAAAVLGAPISTTLIVFELTGDWQTGLAVMVAVSLSTALASRLVDRSFFLTQLERRDIHLAAGPQAYLLSTFRTTAVMRARGSSNAPTDEACWEAIEQGCYVDANVTLEAAMPMFEDTGHPFLPVVSLAGEDRAPELHGALYYVDALRVYNRALAATAAEEHS